MAKILIPINPEYVEKILLGQKKYEYRKIKPQKNNIDKMYIYSTAPVKMVVAEADIEDIIIEKPNKIWELTKDYAGINKDFFDNYYKGKDLAIAYKLGKVTRYVNPKKLEDLGINYVPQSFIYID